MITNFQIAIIKTNKPGVRLFASERYAQRGVYLAIQTGVIRQSSEDEEQDKQTEGRPSFQFVC